MGSAGPGGMLGQTASPAAGSPRVRVDGQWARRVRPRVSAPLPRAATRWTRDPGRPHRRHAAARPARPFDYDGGELTLPRDQLVYWAGGNPFHHHQDFARLRRAFARPDTVVVHEPYWTATARHADIVLPATTSLEREDFAASRGGSAGLRVMRRAVPPHGAGPVTSTPSLTGLAEAAGHSGEEFTEGRDVRQWLRHCVRGVAC